MNFWKGYFLAILIVLFGIVLIQRCTSQTLNYNFSISINKYDSIKGNTKIQTYLDTITFNASVKAVTINNIICSYQSTNKVTNLVFDTVTYITVTDSLTTMFSDFVYGNNYIKFNSSNSLWGFQNVSVFRHYFLATNHTKLIFKTVVYFFKIPTIKNTFWRNYIINGFYSQ